MLNCQFGECTEGSVEQTEITTSVIEMPSIYSCLGALHRVSYAPFLRRRSFSVRVSKVLFRSATKSGPSVAVGALLRGVDGVVRGPACFEVVM